MKKLAAALFALAASPQIIAALSFFALIAEPAEAQNCGSSNPNCVVPTVTPCLSAPGDQRAVNTAYLNNCGLAGGGTVTSVAAGCGTTTFGSAITTSGVIAAKEPVNAITATSYTIANGDCGTLTTFTNAAAQAVTLPQANTPANVNFIAGWYEDVCSRGAGTATITPTVSTINGAATLPLTSGSCARIVSDGTNYQIVSYGGGGGGGGTPGGATTNVQFNNAGSFAGDSGFTYAAGTGQAKLVRSGGPIGTGTIFSTVNNSSSIVNGQVLVGGLNYVDVQGASTEFEVVSDSNPFQAAFITADNTALAGGTVYAKTRATQPTGNTIVSSGDQIMLIAGMGNDGTGYKQAFQILGIVDSAPAASSMPGRLSFLTSPSGSTTPAERLRIDSTGLTTILGNVTMSGLGAGTQTKCLGLTAGNAVVPSAAGCSGGQGPLLPSSEYLGGASGNLSPTFYIPATQTTANQGALEGIGVIASLGADAQAVLQFNMPEVIPAGKTLKLRLLAMANATSGVAKVTVRDGATSAGSSLGTATLNTETQISQTWATADILVENKVTLTTVPTANQILTVLVTFNTTGWTLAATSVWQASIVWE